MHLAGSYRAVFNAARYDEQLTGSKCHVAIAQLDRELTVDDEEQLIGFLVRVPSEQAWHQSDRPPGIRWRFDVEGGR